MVFAKDNSLREIRATIIRDNCSETYMCDFFSCDNPVCTCGSVQVALTPIADTVKKSVPSRYIDIDLPEKKLQKDAKSKTHERDLAFANIFFSQLETVDFNILAEQHFVYKNRITENADINAIDAYFDYPGVEMEGLMYAYNDILPYADQMLVHIDGMECLIFDQFCLLPDCTCTDTFLDLKYINKEHSRLEDFCTLKVIYAKKEWEFEERSSDTLPLKKIRSLIEQQNPDLYSSLSARHKKLKAIYWNCRAKNFTPARQPKSEKVGRNELCPCGSGKKYKKCCM